MQHYSGSWDTGKYAVILHAVSPLIQNHRHLAFTMYTDTRPLPCTQTPGLYHVHRHPAFTMYTDTRLLPCTQTRGFYHVHRHPAFTMSTDTRPLPCTQTPGLYHVHRHPVFSMYTDTRPLPCTQTPGLYHIIHRHPAFTILYTCHWNQMIHFSSATCSTLVINQDSPSCSILLYNYISIPVVKDQGKSGHVCMHDSYHPGNNYQDVNRVNLVLMKSIIADQLY